MTIRKALLGIVALGTLCLAASISQAQTPPTVKLSASPHNLNNAGVVVNNGEICLPCHTPHNATATEKGEFLWNHEVSNKSYKLYTNTHSTRFGATSSANPALDNESRLCLGCHDGAIALDNYGGRTTGNKFMSGDAAIGKDDLDNDHPVGIKYPGLSDDGKTWNSSVGRGYFDPTLSTWGAGGVGGGSVKLIDLPDGSKGIGCGTCHTPHTYTYKFVRMDNAGSAQCFKCHDK